MKWLSILLLLIAAPLAAQVRPSPGEGDPRLQSVIYDPDQIVQLSVGMGYQLMVGLAPGERIETIAVGDSAAWQVTASKRGDYFFVKNVQSGSVTNLTVVTESRIYHFELQPSGYAGDAAYSVNFVYPGVPKAEAAEVEPETFRYRVRGAKAIRPSAIYSIGKQTAIEWPPDRPMPAVFSVENDQETLINGEMREDHYLVAGSPEKLVFRLDRLIARAVRVPNRKPRP
jgi:type IV secretion system protein VirB9